MTLKAYKVYAGESPYESGCLLTFHQSHDKAKALAFREDFHMDYEYTDMRALRQPEYDHCALHDKPHMIIWNDQLPHNVEPFYAEEFSGELL